ncbi:MAG: LptA/OstA family protein [Alphaproteobacteria bacterium]
MSARFGSTVAAVVLAAMSCAGYAEAATSGAPKSNTGDISGLTAPKGQEPVDISSDEAHVSEAERTVILSGHVLARQGEVQLQADTVTVHYLSGARASDLSSKGKIDTLEAHGNVVVTRPGEVVKSMAATYKMIEKQILMHGNVVATRGNSVVRGENLIVDLVKETIQLQAGSSDHRVHAIFSPTTNSGTQ